MEFKSYLQRLGGLLPREACLDEPVEVLRVRSEEIRVPRGGHERQVPDGMRGAGQQRHQQ